MTLLRAIGRNALVRSVTWGALGVLWIFSGKSTGDVMGGSEMWPFMGSVDAFWESRMVRSTAC